MFGRVVAPPVEEVVTKDMLISLSVTSLIRLLSTEGLYGCVRIFNGGLNLDD